MNRFEHLRDIVKEQLALGASYAVLAGALNESGHKPLKGAGWTKHSAYHAARSLKLNSITPCKSQPRASQSQCERNFLDVVSATRHALGTGAISHSDLSLKPYTSVARTLGISAWKWRSYAIAAMMKLGVSPVARLP